MVVYRWFSAMRFSQMDWNYSPSSDIRDLPTMAPGRPWGTENAKNAGPDPSGGPAPSRHLLGSRTRPAIPWEGSAPTT